MAKTIANLKPIRPTSQFDAAAAAAAFAGETEPEAKPSAPDLAGPSETLKRLSLDVPSDLRRRLKQRALTEDRPLRNLAIDAFEAYLSQSDR
jgi:hypothetical protein